MLLNTDDITDAQKKMIKQDLSIYIKSDYGPSRRYLSYIKNTDTYSVPFYWACQKLPEKLNTVFNTTKINIPDTNITLRPSQKPCVEICMNEFTKEYGGGIINLSTGSGKTIISLYIISKVKYRTLIVVNKIELLNQWRDAIHKAFSGKVSVGIIQGSKFIIGDITIAMLQTVSQNKNYTRDSFASFTLVIIDEVHNTPSEVFNRSLHKIRNKYTFGLSATINRKDGMEKIIVWHIGPVLFSDCSTCTKQTTEFSKISYKGASSKEEYTWGGNLNLSKMLNNLAEDRERTTLLATTIKQIIQEPLRRILVLSDRIQLLNTLHRLLGEEISGMFVGSTPPDTKTITKQKQVMLATYSIASEGFNHPELNCLVFATPRSSVKQSIGRIYRKQHSINPLIVDVVDSVGIFICQYNKRKKIYKQELQSQSETELQPDNVCLFT